MKNLEDWYSIHPAKLGTNGKNLLQSRGESMSKTLTSIYPSYPWLLWRFQHVSLPRGFWESLHSQTEFLLWFEEQNNIQSEEEWSKVQPEAVEAQGGRGLLMQHNGSLIRALLAVFPERKWQCWKYGMVPVGFWQNLRNQRAYFDWLAEQLGLEDFEGWYSVKQRDIESRRLVPLLSMETLSFRR